MALHVPPVASETDAIHAFLAQAQGAFRALLARGATVHEESREFGGGYRGAVVIDPFGNALGIMQRPAVPTAAPPETNGEAA
jgi:predicted enzyme related to lactoylglutathione lyase